MGFDINDLPPHVRDQIEEKDPDAQVKVRAQPRQDRMNKTERNYKNHLEKRKMAGEIMDYRFEPFNLRLADRTFYKPDFIVITTDGFIEIHEVKGRWEDDALVKIKVAAENFPWFTFRAVFNECGHWKTRHFNTTKNP